MFQSGMLTFQSGTFFTFFVLKDIDVPDWNDSIPDWNINVPTLVRYTEFPSFSKPSLLLKECSIGLLRTTIQTGPLIVLVQ